MDSVLTIPVKEQACPQCQALLPVHEGYTTWCDRCGWNLQIPELPPFLTLFDRLHLRLGQASSQHLFEHMVKSTPLSHRFSKAKLLAYCLAAPVHGVTLVFVSLGIWLMVITWPNLWSLVLAFPCFLIAWVLLPRLSKLEGKPLARERFPKLYRLTDRIAEALGSRPIDGIVPDVRLNASFSQVGWRRQKIVTLGLPLFAILTGPEKIALLGHEIAHGVNGDSSRGFFIGTALDTLETWYYIIHPENRWQLGVGPIAILMFLINLASLAVAWVIWLWAYALFSLLWRNQQRAEYLADLLAAKVAGTEAHLGLLEKLHMRDSFHLSLKATYLNRDGKNFFTKFKDRVAKVPPREMERIRRVERLSQARLDTTHPPTAHRIEFLKAHPLPEAAVELSAAELADLEQELAPLYEELQNRLFELDSHTFRGMFGLNW